MSRRVGASLSWMVAAWAVTWVITAPSAWAEEASPTSAPTAVTRPPLTRTHWLCEPVPKGCPCPEACIRTPLLRLPCIDACATRWKEAQKDTGLEFSVGGYHWLNYDSETHDWTYGFPGSEGTYFYYLKGTLSCETGSCRFPSWGAHVQVRFRDDTKFRSYFPGIVWIYEAYGYVDVHNLGRFKGGSIWKRFGLDWRGGFWGIAQYWDGLKTDTDYGFSWEQVWNKGRRFEMPTFVQFFIEENGLNGSLTGGDAESSDLFDEGPTGVVRAVPTWHFNENSSLAVGLSGMVGSIEAKSPAAPSGDHSLTGYAVDFTYVNCGFSVYADWSQTFGTQNQSHYVTRGPSDRYSSISAGAKYAYGPLAFRLQYSHSEYDNPGGSQDIYVVGLDAKLTNWLDFTAEYVYWPIERALAADTTIEEGWQFVFHWHF